MHACTHEHTLQTYTHELNRRRRKRVTIPISRNYVPRILELPEVRGSITINSNYIFYFSVNVFNGIHFYLGKGTHITTKRTWVSEDNFRCVFRYQLGLENQTKADIKFGWEDIYFPAEPSCQCCCCMVKVAIHPMAYSSFLLLCLFTCLFICLFILRAGLFSIPYPPFPKKQ